jgi:hypothetical protein
MRFSAALLAMAAALAGCSDDPDELVLAVYESTQIRPAEAADSADLRCLPRALSCPGVRDERRKTTYYYSLTGEPLIADDAFELGRARVEPSTSDAGPEITVPWTKQGREQWERTVRRLFDRARSNGAPIGLAIVVDGELIAPSLVDNGPEFPEYLVRGPLYFGARADHDEIAQRIREG